MQVRLAPLEGHLVVAFYCSLESLKVASELLYRFGKYSLDTELLELRHGESELQVEPQILSLLTYLVKNRDRVVSKDEIFDHVWDGRVVSDATLNTRINGLRRAVGDTGKAQDTIRTFTRRGFRFVADLSEIPAGIQTQDDGVAKTVDHTRTNKPSIAVLPFANISGDPEQQYFSDGLTDDIIGNLSRNWYLLVIARTSTLVYGSKPSDVRQIGRDLDAQYVLEGSVRRSGDRVRVSTQLIATSSGTQVWGNKYDRQMADIFDIQDEITDNIGGAVGAEIYSAETEKARKRTGDLGLYELELKAFWNLTHFTEERTKTSRDYSLMALELDDGYAPAYSSLGLSFCYDGLFGWGSASRDENMKAAFSAASKSVEIDPSNDVAHHILSMTLMHQGEHERAIREAEVSLEINPSFHTGHHMLAFALGYSGSKSFDRITQHMEISRRLAPRHPFMAHFLSVWSIVMTLYNQVDKAVELGQEATSLKPHLTLAIRAHASALALRGEIMRAQDIFSGHDRSDSEFDWSAFKSSQITSIKRAEQRERYFEGLRLAGAPI